MLKNIVKVPYIIKGTRSAWAQYTIQVPNKKIREFLINNLKTQGIPSMIYYENPLHLQTAYKYFPKSNSLKVSEDISKRVLSLPISLKHSSYIVEKFCEVYKKVC